MRMPACRTAGARRAGIATTSIYSCWRCAGVSPIARGRWRKTRTSSITRDDSRRWTPAAASLVGGGHRELEAIVAPAHLRRQRAVFRLVPDHRGAPQDRIQRVRMELADLLVRPLLLAGRERHEEVDRLAQAAAVAGLVIPQVDAHPVTQRGEREERLQIERAVAPGVCPLQLARHLAVRLNLLGQR